MPRQLTDNIALTIGWGGRVKLADNELHLWLVDLEAVEPGLLAAYRDLMSEDELERNQRYRFDSGRFADCVTRALVRTSLSRYVDVDPTAWRFEKGEHGKPEISAPTKIAPLRFNLSHTKRYIVCAITRRDDLGVDIETTQRKNDVLNIADRYFSQREITDLFDLPEHRQHDRFFDYWTLKEAYMKARGEGISLGLGNFSFSIPPKGDIGISFTAQIQDEPQHWQFALFSPKADARLAYAVRSGVRPVVRLFETVPLSGDYQTLD